MKAKLKIKIEAKSDKGQNRIMKYGEWWNVVAKVRSIPEWGLLKPMQYIKPLRVIKGQNGIGSHWMYLKNDPDYAIIEQIE